MATGFNLGGFDDLRAAEAASLLPPPTVNPLEALIGGFQQGAAIRNLPQTMARNALEQQLALAVQQAKLRELQNGRIEQVGNALLRVNPLNNKVETIYTAPTNQAGGGWIGTTQAGVPIRIGSSGIEAIPDPSGLLKGQTTPLQPRTAAAPTSAHKLYVNTQTGQSEYYVPGSQPDGFQAHVRSGSPSQGGLTSNARAKLISDYTDLTGISPGKVLDDLNDGSISLDKMTATVGSMKGSRNIPVSELKNYNAYESLNNEFEKAEQAIIGLENEFGPIQGRWNEFLLRYPVAETDPRVGEVFSLINSLSADQIHDKYGGALTGTEEKRAVKWALDTSLPFSTLKARINQAKSGIASSRSAFEKSLKARNINAPLLFEKSSTPSESTVSTGGTVKIIHPDGRSGSIPQNQLADALKAGFKEVQ